MVSRYDSVYSLSGNDGLNSVRSILKNGVERRLFLVLAAVVLLGFGLGADAQA